jgi:Arc/MetJ-type ribon-helix-helix transcriptional regulator
MKRSIKVTPKKKRGRPATGRHPHVTSRMPQTLIDQVERWAASNEASRSEAIRRLVELGLEKRTPAKPAGKASNKTRAVELAARVVDKMIDSSAPADERDRRRRRLTNGPPEFREDRVDLPKAKGK